MNQEELISTGVASIGEDLFGKPEVEQEIEGDEPAPEPEPPAPTRTPPQSWAKDTHELWTSLDPKVQDQIERREKQMLEGLTQYREHNDFGKQMREVFTPYRQLLESQGIDEPKAAQYLLNAHARLMSLPTPEQKLAYLWQIAGNYGINQPGQAQPDPRLSAIEQRLEGVVGTLTQQQQAAYKEHHSKVTSEVAGFADAKDDKGNLLHPYFNEVADDIVHNINAGKSLDDAYSSAVWSNPVTREKELARVKTDAQASLRARSKGEAEAAMKARSANVRSRDTRNAPTEPLGKMDDTLKETLDNIKSRAH